MEEQGHQCEHLVAYYMLPYDEKIFNQKQMDYYNKGRKGVPLTKFNFCPLCGAEIEGHIY